MAVHEQVTPDKKVGFDKEIEASALPMVLDMLQNGQYSHPIPSTVRELASNGWDAIQEKRAALKILAGKAKVEDYFVHRDEELYRDSNWDPSYYDPFWLDVNNNEVLIQYIEGETYDTVKVTDYGVGIGGNRLLKHFWPGWSSKRNSKLMIGMFGVGSKSALSTGVQYYTEELWYNGRYMKFQVYSHTVDSILPRWDMGTRLENPTMPLGKKTIHYQETTEKNHTVISFTCKKHKKPEFIRAVDSQLLYFKGIRFEIVDKEGKVEARNPQAKVLYEDQHLIISDNTQYTKPHLVINNVCYSYIEWLDLELNDRTGNVGVKVSMEEVSLSPSRENVVWNDKTRAAVMKRVTDSVQGATRLLEKELEGTSLWEWIVKVAEMTVRQDDSVLGRLAKFSSTDNFNPELELEGHRWRASQLWGLFRWTIRSAEVCTLKRQSKTTKLESEPARPVDLENLVVYVTREENRTYRKRKYLCQKHGWSVVFLNLESLDRLILERVMKDSKHLWPAEFWSKALETRTSDEGLNKVLLADLAEKIAGHVRESLLEHIEYEDYDAVEVPAEFKLGEGEEDETVEEQAKMVPVKPQKQKSDAIIEVVMCSGSAVRWEVDPALAGNLDAPEVFVGTKNAADLLGGKFIARIAGGREGGLCLGPKLDGPIDPKTGRPADSWRLNQVLYEINRSEYNRLSNRVGLTNGIWPPYAPDSGALGHYTGAMVVRVSQDLYKKLAARYYTYQEFFVRIDDKLNKISMSNILKNWYTARMIEPAVQKYRFLYFMASFFPQEAGAYQELWQHWIKYRVSDDAVMQVDQEMYKGMMEFCDKIAALQKAIIGTAAGSERIAEANARADALSLQLFDREYTFAEAYDEKLVAYAEGLEKLEPVRELLSVLDLCHPDVSLEDYPRQKIRMPPHSTELAIREYIASKLNL